MSKSSLCHCLVAIEFEGFLFKTLHERDISEVLHDSDVETHEVYKSMKETSQAYVVEGNQRDDEGYSFRSLFPVGKESSYISYQQLAFCMKQV